MTTTVPSIVQSDSWSDIGGHLFPHIWRLGKKYVSVQMIEYKILSKYPSQYSKNISSLPPVISHYMTDHEAQKMNEINSLHKQQFCRDVFTSKTSLIAEFTSVCSFLDVVEKSFSESQQTKGPVGWMQVNNTVVPYTVRKNDRYLSKYILQHAAGLLKGTLKKGEYVTSTECQLLNNLCKEAGLEFNFDLTSKLLPFWYLCKYEKNLLIKDLPSNANPFEFAKYMDEAMMQEICNASKESEVNNKMNDKVSNTNNKSDSKDLSKRPVNKKPFRRSVHTLDKQPKRCKQNVKTVDKPSSPSCSTPDTPSLQTFKDMPPLIAITDEAENESTDIIPETSTSKSIDDCYFISKQGEKGRCRKNIVSKTSTVNINNSTYVNTPCIGKNSNKNSTNYTSCKQVQQSTLQKLLRITKKIPPVNSSLQNAVNPANTMNKNLSVQKSKLTDKERVAVTKTVQSVNPVCSEAVRTSSGSILGPEESVVDIIKTIHQYTFAGGTVPIIQKSVGKDFKYRIALVEALTKVWFPQMSTERFLSEVRTALNTELPDCSRNQELAFIKFFCLPVDNLQCKKVINIDFFTVNYAKLNKIYQAFCKSVNHTAANGAFVDLTADPKE